MYTQVNFRTVCILMYTLISGYFLINAQNPIVTDIFTADPTARVFNNTLYVYPSHDVPNCPQTKENNGFCMPDYFMYSTNDLVNYKNEGLVLSHNSVPWVRPNSYGMWAPDCIEKNGKYYFYFPGIPRDRSAFRKLGVAVADSPTGPFRPERNYIQGPISGIDPGIFNDTNGRSYMYYAQGGNIKVVELKANMKEVQGGVTTFNNFPPGYKEGPFVFKRQGTYYLTFPHIVQGRGYEIVYATSRNPRGPFQYKGTIMPNIANGTNHHSIVQYKGKWYMFYHNWTLSGKNKQRSMRADEIFFNGDGSIRQKRATNRGIGVPKAGDIIQLDRADSFRNVRVEKLPAGEPRGWQLGFIQNNGWVRFDNVNFGSGVQSFNARVSSGGSGGRIEFRINSITGPLLATATVSSTGGWNNWRTIKANTTGNTTGVKNLFCVFKGSGGNLFNVNWVSFSGGNSPNPNPNPNPSQNQKPVVSFIAPAVNASIPNNASVGVRVRATDTDGTISNVKLYLNNRFIRQENIDPYNWLNDSALQNLATGRYTLKAVATDNQGATTERTLQFQVGSPSPAPTGSNGIIANGNYFLKSTVVNENLYSNTSGNNGARMSPPSGNRDQIWTFAHLGDNVYTIRNAATGRYLEVPFAECEDGADVATWTAAGSTHQRWKIERSTSGYSLKPQHCQEMALDRKEGKTRATAQVWTFNTANINQQWNIIGSSGAKGIIDSNSIRTYPNPVSELVYVVGIYEPTLAQITDVNGKLVSTVQLSTADYEINVRNLPSGLYFLRLSNGYTTKLIKE